MHTSSKMIKAMDGWESNVLVAYLDPGGVPTIGRGFTNYSKVLTRMLGKLVPGKTRITREQSDRIYKAMLAEEYEPMVNMPGAEQHEFDVGVSTVWNLGEQSQNWNWAKLWRAGDKRAAADYLASHYNTDNGKKLPGLVRRRIEESFILAKGIYPGEPGFMGVSTAPSLDNETREAQTALKRLGIDPGAIDGLFGPKTRAAVRTYQRMHPHLVNDGVLGPATLAQLRRDIAAVKKTVRSAGSGLAGSGAAAYALNLPWGWIVAAVAVALVVYFGWKYRDVWQRRFNKLIGRTVEV